MTGVRVYLLDIEGTVAPISLVYEQLFPYARRHLREFLREHCGDAGVGSDLRLLAEENSADTATDAPRYRAGGSNEEAAAYLLWLMDRDRKSTALKSLQGRVWKQGFEAGELVGTLFPDVPEALQRWSREARVAIYSSGSVEAQRLLLRYSSAGDLSALIASYFDTRVGAKREAASYRAIAGELGVEPGEMLFLSDVVAELDAARAAGCLTQLAVREGNAAASEGHGHLIADSFFEIG